MLPVIAASFMLFFTSCGNRHNGSKDAGREHTAADTIVQSAIDAEDYPRALALCDSLEQAGAFSAMRADYYRGSAYEESDSTDYAKACYRRVTASNDIAPADYWCYQEAGGNICRMLFNEQNLDSLLVVAVPVMSTIDSLGNAEPRIKIMLRSMMGISNRELGQPQQAEENLNRTHADIQQWLATDTTTTAVTLSVNVYTNIAMNYNNDEEYEKSMTWIARGDSLLPALSKVNPVMADRFGALLLMQRAKAEQGLGHLDESAQAYDQYLQTPFSETDYGKLSAIDYLYSVGRYAEAADNYAILDRFMQQNGIEMTLDNLYRLVRKFEVNYRSGRRDTALYVANIIAENYWDAYSQQVESEAAKFATIYDTQGKERQIARQQADLLRQRIIGLIIAIVLLTIFFIVYTLVRRRHAHRLAEMRAAQERIESELQIARNIQMSMVPSQFPNYEGLDMYASMTPAKEVGGDLYGYVLLGDKLYFAVGDVSGKGVPASLFMAQATRLFRTLAAQQMMPAEICTRMNDALSGEDNESGMFVTFFLGLLDLQTGHLDFCNAGHNPPVIGGGEQHGQFLEMIPNAPIGLWPGLEYEGEQIENIKGRPLFVYTDGLNEAENRQQEQFGDDHLLDILRTTHFDSARQVIETLQAEVEHHRNGAAPNDDLTMMCIRLK